MRFSFLFVFLCTVAAAAPSLTYSTYLQSGVSPKAIATDLSGNVYLAGSSVVKVNGYSTPLNGPSANAIAVDGAGNAYVAGLYKTVTDTSVAFVAKLDSAGKVLFFTSLGGTAQGAAQAVAVNAAGQILVSGISYSSGFPSTPGAYSVSETKQHPFLLELDASGTKVVFSATGIGGSAMVLDASGNIYVAGTTSLLDYPTTPGSYQPVLPAVTGCFSFFCQAVSQLPNQYVSKIDPAGRKLIYSTALSGKGSTTNAGLAVDADGSVYVTGYAGQSYPYTVAAPAIGFPTDIFFANFSGLPFLSKLDAAGQTLLFSIPVGGAGVQVDASGNVYAGGAAGSYVGAGYAVDPNLPVLANVPSECLPSNTGIQDVSYVAQVEGSSGNVLGSQFLGGSTLVVSGIAVSGPHVWAAGPTADGGVAFTPNAVIPTGNAGAGAYVGAVDFTAGRSAGGPQIACIVDSANLMPAGVAARSQLLSIYGTGLGPADGVAASDYATTSLAGVAVNTGGTTAPLLYVSSQQINFVVPALASGVSVAPVEIFTGAGTDRRAIPLVSANPSLMMNRPLTLSAAPGSGVFGFVALALNADGSVNSPTNPAAAGSVISVFVNGAGSGSPQFSAAGWPVVQTQQINPFIWEVGLQTPSVLGGPPYSFACGLGQGSLCLVKFSLSDTLGAAFYMNR